MHESAQLMESTSRKSIHVYPCAPCERQKGNSPVLGHRVSNLRSSADCSTDGRRDRVSSEYLLDYLSDCDGGERGGGSTLPEGTVATDQTEAVVPTKDGHREIERRDDPDHTQWVPLLQKSVTRPCKRGAETKLITLYNNP